MSNITTKLSGFGGDIGSEPVDTVWLILCTFIILTMQTGFGLFESGFVSSKNQANAMIKILTDVSLGGAAYWFVGYGFSFGPNTKSTNDMSGEGHFITDVNLENEAYVYTKFFFQLSFATTSTTIISGAVAERIYLLPYMIIAIINTGLIYVFPAHWMWDTNGWLYKKGAHDLAGSVVVHIAGGAAALAAAIILGPREGKFSEPKKSFRMSSPSNVILGTLFLWWGWVGFNCGSTFIVSNGTWRVASKVAVTTMNGAIAGGASGVLLSIALKLKRKYLVDVSDIVTGILGGLVAVTASADVIRPYEGLIIGFVGGAVGNGATRLVELLKIDDPVGAVGVHYFAGAWGMFATGFFADMGFNGGNSKLGGVFRHGDGTLLAYNIVAIIVVSLWSGGINAVVILVLKYTMGIKMTPDEQLRGTDALEHNITNDDECPKDDSPDVKKHTRPSENNLGHVNVVLYRNNGNDVEIGSIKETDFSK